MGRMGGFALVAVRWPGPCWSKPLFIIPYSFGDFQWRKNEGCRLKPTVLTGPLIVRNHCGHSLFRKGHGNHLYLVAADCFRVVVEVGGDGGCGGAALLIADQQQQWQRLTGHDLPFLLRKGGSRVIDALPEGEHRKVGGADSAILPPGDAAAAERLLLGEGDQQPSAEGGVFLVKESQKAGILLLFPLGPFQTVGVHRKLGGSFTGKVVNGGGGAAGEGQDLLLLLGKLGGSDGVLRAGAVLTAGKGKAAGGEYEGGDASLQHGKSLLF